MDPNRIEEKDFPEVQAFLQEVFGPMEPRKLTGELWRWKCTQPHPLWPGSRGFLRRNADGRLVAYASLIPLRFLTPQGAVPSSHVIDWAAQREVPGAGIRLYRHLQVLTGSVIGIGGSQDTRNLLPRIGAIRRQTVSVYLRHVRPLAAALRGKKDWKWLARLLRSLSTLRLLPGIPRDFTAVPVSRFDRSVEPSFPTARESSLVPERSVDLLNYWLQCPATKMSGYRIEYRGETVGYFLLSMAPPLARIADLWVAPVRTELWQWSYAQAFRTAAASPEILQVETISSHPEACQALDRMGLPRRENPVFLLDPEHSFPADVPLSLTAMEYDGFYL